MGSQLTAASSILNDFLNEAQVSKYLEDYGIRKFEFKHYYKGNSALGSLVESAVKLVKKFINGSIRKNILETRSFELVVSNTINLVNKRPVAFTDALRSESVEDAALVITPELLIHGRNLPIVNLIPGNFNANDPDFKCVQVDIPDQFSKFNKIRANLIEIYNVELSNSLISQATKVNSRYKPVLHRELRVGDIVILKEKYSKAIDYPIGLVKEVIHNDLGEVTNASVWKGSSKELVKRHVNSLIYLFSPANDHENVIPSTFKGPLIQKRPKRKAAQKCREWFSKLD